jgi:hypothetical protein
MEWDLLDLTGPIDSYDIHRVSESLVYSAGTVIVVWEIGSDRKVNLR